MEALGCGQLLATARSSIHSYVRQPLDRHLPAGKHADQKDTLHRQLPGSYSPVRGDEVPTPQPPQPPRRAPVQVDEAGDAVDPTEALIECDVPGAPQAQDLQRVRVGYKRRKKKKQYKEWMEGSSRVGVWQRGHAPQARLMQCSCLEAAGVDARASEEVGS